MRELTLNELKAVSGGIIAVQPKHPIVDALRRLIVRVLDSIRPGRGGPVTDPRQT